MAFVLRYVFKAASLDEMDRLSAVFARVISEGPSCRYALPVNNHPTFFVGFDAPHQTGKSAFIKRTIGHLTHGKKVEFREKILGDQSVPANQVTAWSNSVLPAEQLQYRAYDSGVTGPFNIGWFSGFLTSLALQNEKLPERIFPGIDFVEHTKKVPPWTMICQVAIKKDDSGIRRYGFYMTDQLANSAAVQSVFLPQVSDLRIF